MTHRCRIKLAFYLAFIFFVLGLISCTPYPPDSTGGYAAHYYLTKLHDFRRGPTSAYHLYVQRYTFLIEKLYRLNNSKVRFCYPARMVEMNLLSRQIADEIVAGLFLSAQKDINLLYGNIDAVWAFQNARGCPKLKYNKDWQILKMRIQ